MPVDPAKLVDVQELEWQNDFNADAGAIKRAIWLPFTAAYPRRGRGCRRINRGDCASHWAYCWWCGYDAVHASHPVQSIVHLPGTCGTYPQRMLD